ncbi:unnamed protein product [Protopolystoma xenopodis]|uniref:Uncharacterized protein n=1 Tax=Protopolystoma xenopodis TaxID=117903 RepID=A0A448X168_9PLAT|nr:unnamed protein product [Protopolystoma xenopodis]
MEDVWSMSNGFGHIGRKGSLSAAPGSGGVWPLPGPTSSANTPPEQIGCGSGNSGIFTLNSQWSLPSGTGSLLGGAPGSQIPPQQAPLWAPTGAQRSTSSSGSNVGHLSTGPQPHSRGIFGTNPGLERNRTLSSWNPQPGGNSSSLVMSNQFFIPPKRISISGQGVTPSPGPNINSDKRTNSNNNVSSILSNLTNTAVHAVNTTNSSSNNAGSSSDIEDIIKSLVNTTEAWGQRPVDQSTPWDLSALSSSLALAAGNSGSLPGSGDEPSGTTPGSPVGHSSRGLATLQSSQSQQPGLLGNAVAAMNFQQQQRRLKSGLSDGPGLVGGLPGGLFVESNIWPNEPPNGTGIWESHYEGLGERTARWQQAQQSHVLAAAAVAAQQQQIGYFGSTNVPQNQSVFGGLKTQLPTGLAGTALGHTSKSKLSYFISLLNNNIIIIFHIRGLRLRIIFMYI